MCDWTLNSWMASGGGLIAQMFVKMALFKTPSNVKLFSCHLCPLTDGLRPPPPIGIVKADCCPLSLGDAPGVSNTSCVNCRPFRGRSTTWRTNHLTNRRAGRVQHRRSRSHLNLLGHLADF